MGFKLICIKDSWSCNFMNNGWSNILIRSGSVCITKQLDFGANYLNWIGIWCDGKYCGAYCPDKFQLFFEWRNSRIDSILE